MTRRAAVGVGVLVAAALAGAGRSVALGVEAALEGGIWRRSLVGADGVSAIDDRLQAVRAAVPRGATVEVVGVDVERPVDGMQLFVVRYALAPRRVRVRASGAPFVLAVGDVAPVESGLSPVLDLGSGVVLLRRDE